MKSGVNFAGNMALIEIGCGTGCKFVYAANVQTGQILNFPLGGDANPSLSLQYQSNSKLVIAHWPNEERCIRQSVVWNGSSFRQIETIDLGRVEDCSSDAKLSPLEPVADRQNLDCRNAPEPHEVTICDDRLLYQLYAWAMQDVTNRLPKFRQERLSAMLKACELNRLCIANRLALFGERDKRRMPGWFESYLEARVQAGDHYSYQSSSGEECTAVAIREGRPETNGKPSYRVGEEMPSPNIQGTPTAAIIGVLGKGEFPIVDFHISGRCSVSVETPVPPHLNNPPDVNSDASSSPYEGWWATDLEYCRDKTDGKGRDWFGRARLGTHLAPFKAGVDTEKFVHYTGYCYLNSKKQSQIAVTSFLGGAVMRKTTLPMAK